MFFEMMSHVRKQYEGQLEPVCKKYQLTRMEMDILLFLYNNPQYDTAKDIVEKRLLTKSHVSTAIQKLCEKNYLEKHQTVDNKKLIHLKICDAAQPVLDEGKAAQNQFFKRLFHGFSAEELKELEQAFQRFYNNMKEV